MIFRILKSFAKDLKKIKDKNLLQKVQSVTEYLKENVNNIEREEDLPRMKDTKKLIGTCNAYRIKVGSDYRIGAEIDLVTTSDNKEEKYFSLKRFLHRKDIYRKFPIKK